MKTQYLFSALALLVLSTLNSQLSTAHAQGTAFTYQGHLSNTGTPANGLYDFRFKLAMDDLGNNYVGNAYLTNAVTVTNGLFTTTADFGAAIFTGTNYWLEVDVRTNNPANILAYTTLAPLQGVTPTPYAVMANSASNLLGNVPVAQLSGTVPLAQLPGAVVTNNEGYVTLGNVAISGSLTLPFPVTITTDGGAFPILHDDGNENFFAGLGAGDSITSGYGNESVGNDAFYTDTVGSYNVANGFGALANNLNGNNNVASGFDALWFNVSGGDNTAYGTAALYGNLTGNENVAAGSGSLQYSTNDSQLVAIGYQTLQNDNAYNNGNTLSGYGNNTAIGYQALQSDTVGAANTAIGYQALNQNTSGIDNIAVGDHALLSNTSGSYNDAVGVDALQDNTSGSNNMAYGSDALYGNTSGGENTALGVQALFSNGSGNNNIAVGNGAGDSLISGNNNIYIGNNGNSTESGVIRIGTPGNQTITYLPGALNVDESGLNVGNINSNAFTFGVSSGEGILSKRVSGTVNSYDLELWTAYNSRLTILQNGNVGIGTTNPIDAFEAASSGVAKMTLDSSGNLECAGTVYSKGIALTSDRNAKENFQPVDSQTVLAKVAALPVTKWNYKTDRQTIQHVGPMAQDFQAAFGLDGSDDKHISIVDEGGVALAAIQGLNQKLDQTRAENAQLKQQNDSLTERLNELEITVKQLATQK